MTGKKLLTVLGKNGTIREFVSCNRRIRCNWHNRTRQMQNQILRTKLKTELQDLLKEEF